MKYEKLAAYVNNEDWENAVMELKSLQVAEIDDVLAILGAAICFHFDQIEYAYTYIREGLRYNHRNYELYFLLGNYYEYINPYQAWLCYENAEFYCTSEEDRKLISGYRAGIETQGIKPAKTSIVILSYNIKYICMSCIESIRRYNPKSAYEIVVVDNASVDGIREWLQDQEDITLICNEENVGFPMGCNQGIEASQAGNDIFLLNNDTMLLPNSLFWLRMALYDEEETGAVGSMSNFAGNGQMIKCELTSVDEVVRFGASVNIPEKNALEKKIWLVGYALLLKRKALDAIGGGLDTRFSPGGYEDNDIGVRLRYAGWKVYLCHNSFIVHYGGGAGLNREMWNEVEKNNKEKFREKWGFNIRYYTNPREDIISLIKRDRNDPIHVLEVGCGGGATLSRIEYLFPNAEVKGIELVVDVARLGINQVDIIQGNIETMQLPYEKQYFDYILFGDVLEHLYDPEAVLMKLKSYLHTGGQFLCSIPNVMHESVILSLLLGEFRYEDAGILDRTHIRFFTWNSICAMLNRCGLVPTDLSTSVIRVKSTKENEEILQAIYSLPHIAPKEQFKVYQYVLSAGIADDAEVKNTGN